MWKLKNRKKMKRIDTGTDCWVPETGGRRGWAKWVKGVKKYKLPVKKKKSIIPASLFLLLPFVCLKSWFICHVEFPIL